MKIAKKIADALFKRACWSESNVAWQVDDSFYKEDVYKTIAATLEPLRDALQSITDRLNNQWYQTDPFPGCSDSIKEGDDHPWVAEIREALSMLESDR